MPERSRKQNRAKRRALCAFLCLAIAGAEACFISSCTRTADEPEGKIRFALTREELELFEGEEYVLCIIKTPADGKKTPVVWRADDANVADVNCGRISAHKEGETFISAQTREYTLTCKVTVKKCETKENTEKQPR